MTVHPFRIDPDPADDIAEFPDDFHEDFAGFDDADNEMTRFGSVDRQYRYAHRTISASLLATVTGVPVPECQAFHHVVFALLEDVGDADGLIATSGLLIAGRRRRVNAATGWLATHTPPVVAQLLAASDPDESAESIDRHIAGCIERHSLGLAVAADTNPSLSLGSLAALEERLVADVLDWVLTCDVDEIQRLTAATIELLCGLPGSIRLIGGATLTPRPQ